MMLNKGNLMLRNIFNAISDVVHIACRAEHHDASLFVLEYDVDQPTVDVLSPTQAGWATASGGIETKDGTLI
jgi:methenyltetrahydromethanopterin cyclohydrolase